MSNQLCRKISNISMSHFLYIDKNINIFEDDIPGVPKVFPWTILMKNNFIKDFPLGRLGVQSGNPDMRALLDHCFNSLGDLLFPHLNGPFQMTQHFFKTSKTLVLIECVASHPETRSSFLAAHIPLYLYPFLQTVSKTRPFEYLRLTSLGVIGALVKTDEQEVINFLLTTEIIPLCLRIMEAGSELSKTVATFILQKILLDETGLNYICQTYERFSHVAMILGKMVIALAKEQSARLLKHVIRCYLRLSDNPRAREALRQCLPDQLKDQTFAGCLKDDKSTKHWLQQLLANLESTAPQDPRITLPPLAAQ
ncbi:unnamed protein product, partial [Meganyctiphanes norvegica]